MLKKGFFILMALLMASGCGADREKVKGSSKEEPQVQTKESSVQEKLEITGDVTVASDAAVFDLKAKNVSQEQLSLTFHSGQEFEVVVMDGQGEEVYRYSAGKMFTEAIKTISLDPGKTLAWQDKWVFPEEVQGGSFKVKMFVTSRKINDKEVEIGTLSTTTNFTLPETDNQSKNTSEQQAFRNVSVSGGEGSYTITGEAQVFEGTFFYTVDDGHNYIVEEKMVQVKEGGPGWFPFQFEVSIPPEKLPENGTLNLTLYERSAKDDSIVNEYSVALDQFK